MNEPEIGQWAALAAALAAPFLASWWYCHKSGIGSGATVLKVLLGGMAAGRLAFVMRHANACFAAPSTIMDRSDGP